MQSVAYPQNTEDATKLASLSNCPNNCATRTRQIDESCRPRIEGEALRTAGGGGRWVGWGLVGGRVGVGEAVMYVSFAAMGCCETTRHPSVYFSDGLLATHLRDVHAQP